MSTEKIVCYLAASSISLVKAAMPTAAKAAFHFFRMQLVYRRLYSVAKNFAVVAYGLGKRGTADFTWKSDNRAVQVLMGHKCIETTLRYSHLGETELHNAVERLTARQLTLELAPSNPAQQMSKPRSLSISALE